MADGKVRAEGIVLYDAEVLADAKVQFSSNFISYLSKHYGLRKLLGSAISVSLYDA